MDALFSAYDRWSGLLTLVAGVYATLLAYGYLPRNPKDPARLALWRKRFGPMMKVVAPLVILSGAFSAISAQMHSDPVAETVQKLNANGARMVDAVTRFDRAIAGPGQRITLVHTINNLRASQISLQAWHDFEPKLRQQVVNPATEELRRKGITLVYRYLDSSGVLIGEMTVSPSDPK